MACRIAKSYPTARAGGSCAALLTALILLAPARAQNPPPVAGPSAVPSPYSAACRGGSAAVAGRSPLPNVAAALKRGGTLRILTIGAAPGRVSPRGDYSELIEAMLEGALKNIDVIMINRGVSGELAADAAERMKNEVALEAPDLVLWQVGTNDALAYVPAGEFAATVKDQVDWLKEHKVDVVLVGLQFAPEMLRDAHYKLIRDTLRQVAAREKVIVIRFYEAMEILNKAAETGQPVAEQFERSQAGYDCLAQYVAHAITLGMFAKNMPKSAPNSAPKPPPPK
jgi:acyl-CoA thioesterase-1